MRLVASSIFLIPYVLASEPVLLQSTSDNVIPSAPSVLSVPSSQQQVPYLELRNLDLDRRQIQPPGVGAPAQAAAGARLASAPNAPIVNPSVQTLAATPITPVVPSAVLATPLVATPPAVVPPVAAPAGAGNGGVIGGIPVTIGPAIARESSPPPKAGKIGMGTLTGKIGVVKTDEARSDAVLAAGNGFASWPSAIKVGASLLLGTALGVGILL